MLLATDDREGAARRHAAKFPGLTAEDMLEFPHVLIGTPEKIAEDEGRREDCKTSDIGLDTGVAKDFVRFTPRVAQLAGR